MVTFEGSYGDYTGHPDVPSDAYQPLSWSPVDPNKIWHIVYGVATEAEMENVIALSKSRNAGYIYVTNGVPTNPYDKVPSLYWSQEQASTFPSGTLGSVPPTAPTGLTASARSGSTEVLLNWQPSTAGSASVVGFDIYQGSTWVGSVGSDADSFLVTGLSPSTTYSFTVVARDSYGDLSSPSEPVTATTIGAKPLPDSPTSLTLTDSSFTTSGLQWRAPDSGDQVGEYVVSQDGTPVATVPGSFSSVEIQGLQPGLERYTFSVRAEGVSGSVSAPSNSVEATTTPLPDHRAISSPSVVANGDGTLTYSARFATPFAFRRVFISTGTSPCWTTENATPICADYLIENDQVLKYSGSGSDFTYTLVDTVPPTVTNGDEYSWTIRAADIGTPTGQVALFNGEGYSPLSYTAPISQGTAPALDLPHASGDAADLEQRAS